MAVLANRDPWREDRDMALAALRDFPNKDSWAMVKCKL